MEPDGAISLLEQRLKNWRPDLVGTLMFVTHEDRVLLIRKKRGHGAGKINGPGGKLDAGETPAQCAVRETLEETGVTVEGPRLAAIMRFVALDGDDWLGYVFLAGGYAGRPRETVEAVPRWFPIAEIPFDEMWDDDRIWLPRLLAGEVLAGDFLFRGGALLAHRLCSLGHGDAARLLRHDDGRSGGSAGRTGHSDHRGNDRSPGHHR